MYDGYTEYEGIPGRFLYSIYDEVNEKYFIGRPQDMFGCTVFTEAYLMRINVISKPKWYNILVSYDLSFENTTHTIYKSNKDRIKIEICHPIDEVQYENAVAIFNKDCYCEDLTVNTCEKNENLLSYAKKVNWVTESPIPIKMYSGTKELIVNENGTFTVKYILDKDKHKSFNTEFLKKICIGKIKRLKNKTYICYRNCTEERAYYFFCGNVEFDEENLVLIINDIPYSEVYKRDLIDAIRDLDLELLMSNSNIVNFSNVLSACHDWCRDYGQFHWIGNRNEEKEENSNIYWYNK
mgnify:CR=1 FL=1